MLRKIAIVLALIAVGMTAVQTDAFARGGGGGGGGGFVEVPYAGHVAVVPGGFTTRDSGLHVRGGRGLRRGFGGGDWGYDCNGRPYDYDYGYSCY